MYILTCISKMENTSQMPDTENWFLLWKYIFARSCKLIFVICIFSVYIFIIKSKTFNVTFFCVFGFNFSVKKYLIWNSIVSYLFLLNFFEHIQYLLTFLFPVKKASTFSQHWNCIAIWCFGFHSQLYIVCGRIRITVYSAITSTFIILLTILSLIIDTVITFIQKCSF